MSTRYNTGNPIESTDVRDMSDNAKNFDEMVNSSDLTFTDRFGVERLTIEGLIKQYGINPAQFDFQSGGVLNHGDNNRGVLWSIPSGGDGQYYLWKGAYPKVIPEASTPASTGGVSDAGWLPFGDITLRGELASSTGVDLIGTTHRGSLAEDLDKIDRRSDGYSTVSAAFSYAHDVILGGDVTISSPIAVGVGQTLDGRGGKISTVNTRAINVNGGRVENINILGDVTPTGAPNYSISINNDESVVDGVTAASSTGAVFATDVQKFNIRKVLGKGLVYHPSLVAGGYAVLLQSCGYGIVDGVVMEVDGPLDSAGRHMLYLSVNQSNPVPQVGIVAANMVAKYNGRDNRDMWSINARALGYCVVANYALVGCNGGMAVNTNDGDVEYFVAANAAMRIEKYDEKPVYGESTLSMGGNSVVCNVFSNKAIQVAPKAGLLDYTGCHALSTSARNSSYNNYVTAVPAESWPVLINAGAHDLLFNGFTDLVIPGGGGATRAMFRFTGAASRIKVMGTQTTRPMFSNLAVVTDLSVDFARKVKILSTSGVFTYTDPDTLVASASVSATNEITVVFNSHVTANAVNTAIVRFTQIAAPHIAVANITNKTMRLQFFSPSGVTVPVASNTVGVEIIISE